MARGDNEKKVILESLRQSFPDAFLNGKELRIPFGDVQIKVSLVAAKDCISTVKSSVSSVAEPSEKELEEVSQFLSLVKEKS